MRANSDLVGDGMIVAAEQLPEDVGKAGPLGLLLTVFLGIAIVLLVMSMSRHLKRIPASFDPPSKPPVVVPDSPAELVDDSGEQLLDRLRRAPRAIEPPRPDDRPRDGGR
jgi:hypothetical protein